jgi:hypothetical protein
LQVFKYAFVPVWRLQTTVCTTSILAVWLVLSLLLDKPITRPGIAITLSTSASCALILAVVTASVKFRVSAEGIRTFDSWGRWKWLPWSDIACATPAKYYFLPHIRLTVDGASRSFWVPLFLKDMQAFRDAVTDLAGAENPLSQSLPVPARTAHRAAN